MLPGSGLVLQGHLPHSGLVRVSSDRRVGPERVAALLDGSAGAGPTYAALADGLRSAVLAGALPPRTRLPSERELAASLGLSRTTVSAAFDRLRTEGYLVSRQGSGTVTALPSGVRRSPRFSDTPDEALLDLTKAAPGAPPELAGACTAAVEDLRHLSGRGYSPFGVPALRAAVAAWYDERGVPTSPEQILVTTGAQQAIHLVVGLWAGRGDRVVVEHPTYPLAIEAVRRGGARPVPVPVGPSGVDVDLLRATVTRADPRLVYLIPDFQNPTGTVLDPDRRRDVRTVLAAVGVPLVVDEVFAELGFDLPAPAPLVAGDGRGVIGIGSGSKTYWGGLRVGWVRAHPDVIARLAARRASVDIGTSVLDQLVLTRLLAERGQILVRRRAELRRQRDELLALLATHLPSWRATAPAGGLSLWVDLGAPASTALALRGPACGVHLVPGTAFGVDGTFDDRLRLTFSEPEEVLATAVERIAAAWATLDRPVTGRRPWAPVV